MPPKSSSGRGGRGRGRGRGGKASQQPRATASANGAEMDDIEILANKLWLGNKGVNWSDESVVDIMRTHIVGKQYARSSLQTLERLQYFELYLWANYISTDDTLVSDTHIMSILLMANEKYQQGVISSMWTAMEGLAFGRLFDRVVRMTTSILSTQMAVGLVDVLSARSVVAQFLIACFGSLETECVRTACMPLASLALWEHIDDTRVLVEAEFERMPQLRKFAKHLKKKRSANGDLLPALLRDFIAMLFSGDNSLGRLAYCTKFVELLVDLESQLATRRYVNLLLVDYQVLDLCQVSEWYRMGSDAEPVGRLAKRFRDMVGMLRGRVYFQVNDVSGLAMTEAEAKDRHYQRVAELQITAFKEFPRELEALALASVASLSDSAVLTEHLEALDDMGLRKLAALVGIRTRSLLPLTASGIVQEDGLYGREFVLGAFVERYRVRPTVADQVREISPYPSESLLFSKIITETDQFSKQQSSEIISYPVLAVPKLNLQFLTLHDYLARCFELYRLECAYDIRENIEDAVRRLQPTDAGGFEGWARMAMPMHSFNVVDVQKPRVGARAPSRVRADICIDLANYAESVKMEWDSEVRPRDVLILFGGQETRFVRGCEVECRLDINGKPIDEFSAIKPSGTLRNLRVLLDTHQYQVDLAADKDVYGSLNVVMRRRPQENNFKAVLETVRDLMTSSASLLPDWLASTFLGYGDPSAALVRGPESERVYFGDTFVSADHVREIFADEYPDIVFEDMVFGKPCVIEFPPSSEAGSLRVSSERAVDFGPMESIRRRENTVQFTAAQVAAIRAAAQPGLALVVGPPGTGKTDVAVQIISNLYHAHPRQTILLLTHSNQALNQLFEKIIALDIEPRHLLRLGHGEEDLDAEERYSKAGRVESYLDRRRELLALVQRLAEALDIPGDFGYTCDNARLFFIAHVRMRWEPYYRRITEMDIGDVVAGFPFTKFFDLGTPLFASADGGDLDLAAAIRVVEGCYRYIESIFDELSDIQPFELLRNNAERSNYLLTNQARIVAMTCTHAALKRSELIKLGFRYDTVVMEEAAQVLDIETFIPLTLQSAKGRGLKRLVMIGDHNQLPPVVKNSGLRAYANMEQSLFTRMVRLGVPYVELNRQARARPEIASLYRWRYRGLADLEPHVTVGEFASALNPGFASTFQFINLVGEESEPSRYFYQNLDEAEFVVAMYQYMRLLGYPADRIAILTTYNGQRALIRDVLDRRCKWLPYFGQPRAVATVDQYQGQQSDYVLLSLVRTRSVGHIRDLRRLTVALSRARLGLYVVGCRRVFETCFELRVAIQRLLANGDQLSLCPGERFSGQVDKDARKVEVVEGVEDMGQLVYKMIEEHLGTGDGTADGEAGDEDKSHSADSE
ncbi:hypothetical protein GGH94_001486 [Coemansia aciculifera]|uniref:Pre-mRNA-splicing factor n=1 Tax=Coemansia aciculifera TaxID=417176 RepID=A0A9W8M6D0_9FUNG|nr:hypothetical protein GGH94_001486 [Coemansia aciculifera]